MSDDQRLTNQGESFHDDQSPTISATPWLVAALLVALAALFLGYFRPWFPAPLHRTDAIPRAITARGDLAQDEKATIALFEQSRDSVVHITSRTYRRFRFNAINVQEGTGTGFVWDQDGHIVTNYHVIGSALDSTELIVRLRGGATYPAQVVGGAPDRDVAVLKIDAPKSLLTPIAIGSSHDLAVGQKVFAIGNPFGLDHTLTTGVISGLGREIAAGDGALVPGQVIPNVIQTDAAINPGNSGGPLLDSAGRLIGMNTAIVSASGNYAGVGFAIPVDDINRFVPQIMRTGTIDRVGLGIRPQNWAEENAEQYGVPSQGVLVTGVQPGSPADKAGIRPSFDSEEEKADVAELLVVIVKIDEQPIKDVTDLFNFIATKKAGDVVTLTLFSDGKYKEVEVTLEVISENVGS